MSGRKGSSRGATSPTPGRGGARGSRRDSARNQRLETRAERIERQRLERAEAQARQERVQRIKTIALLGGGAATVALVVVLIVHAIVTAPPDKIAGVVTFTNLSHTHVTGKVTYPQVPPVGGDHNQIWLNCGIYDQPVANENAVHSMEHGAVWITYQPNLPSSAVDQLRGLVRGHSYAILSPYTGLPSPVVASAWGLQLKMQSASDSRLAQFISKYEQGPQTPEPGAPCSGGTGTPIG
jgi:hypothetical protein